MWQLTEYSTSYYHFRNPTPGPDHVLDVMWKPATTSELVYLNIDKEMSMRHNLRSGSICFWDDINETTPDQCDWCSHPSHPIKAPCLRWKMRNPATLASVTCSRVLQTMLENGSDKTSKHFYEMLKLKNMLKCFNLSSWTKLNLKINKTEFVLWLILDYIAPYQSQTDIFSISNSSSLSVIAHCFPHKYLYTGMRKMFNSRSSNIGKFGNSQGRFRKHGPWPINPHGTSSHTQKNCTAFTLYDCTVIARRNPWLKMKTQFNSYLFVY